MADQTIRVYGRTFREPFCKYDSLIDTRIRECWPAKLTLILGLIPLLGVALVVANTWISIDFDNEFGLAMLAWKVAVIVGVVQVVYGVGAVVVFYGVLA